MGRDCTIILPCLSSAVPFCCCHLLTFLFLSPFARSEYSVARVSCRQRLVAQSSIRCLATGSDDGKPTKGSSKWTNPFDLLAARRPPDNLIPTNRDHKLPEEIAPLPEFVTDDIKKDLEELGLDSLQDLDELEEKNMDGFNDLGLVPPEGAGSFASPILIPSRMDNRVVGYQDPETHAMFWFTIHNDENIYYIKDLGLFFKMLHIPDESVGAHH